MKIFSQTPEFAKELKRLEKKYRSLPDDLVVLEEILRTAPVGIGKNFTIMHDEDGVQVVKVRLACRSLKNRSLRVIYAHSHHTLNFLYIEIYAKSDKENEDRERIQGYLNSLSLEK